MRQNAAAFRRRQPCEYLVEVIYRSELNRNPLATLRAIEKRAVSAAKGIRFCSLIPGLGVKLSNDILAGPTVLSAVGVGPPHDGVR